MSYVGGSLQERSEVYFERAALYEEFSRAEDAAGLVLDFLRPRVAGLDLLDVGCGSGKYVELLAPFAKSVTGLDASPAQLEIARSKAGGSASVELVLGDAVDAKLPKASYGVAIACWMLGTVLDLDRRRAIVDRVDSLLLPGGAFHLVENDAFGAFESMRGREAASAAYGEWLRGAGFERSARLESHLQFASAADASRVIGSIWGAAVGALAASARIEHRIAAWSRPKTGA